MQVNPNSIDSVKLKITEWRSERPSKGRRMPDKLWAAAVELSKQYGIGTVAQQLKLDATKLRKLSLQNDFTYPAKRPTNSVSKNFRQEELPRIIEVASINLPAAVNTNTGAIKNFTAQPTLVVERPNGSRLTLYVPLDGEILSSLMREVLSCSK